jgi:Uma2 family endonuclease
LLTAFEEESGLGLLIPAPFDVLIRRIPKMQTRQPDLLFLSHTRAAQGGGIPENGALEVAPELVIEIISNSETHRILGDKIADYTVIGVEECWVIRPETRTVELLEPNRSGDQRVVVFEGTMPLTSRVFSNLSLPLSRVFKP